jgi:hypothetical protein
MAAFLGSIKAPRYPGKQRLAYLYKHGNQLFREHCAACHENHGQRRRILTNDEVNPLADEGENATNACRAMTTNWDAGMLWAQFSSAVYKERGEEGKGYRTMPLAGIWATAPFMHNQSTTGPFIKRGSSVSGNTPPQLRALAYWGAMLEMLRGSDERTPWINVTPIDLMAPDGTPIPAGTPLELVINQSRCDDFIQNRGHHYGSDLSHKQKTALIYWLLYQ